MTNLLIAAAVTGTALLGFTPTAAADNPLCPANTICVYKHANYAGGRFTYPAYTTGYDRFALRSYNTGGTIDNSISSVINNTDYRIEFRENWYIPCNGAMFTVFPHTEVNDLSQRSTFPPERIVNANDIFSCASIYV
ncbi:peptidase inhibitor family I36 protein [Nocardia sp. NRRL S-836]|uniref:peptidase inhibitor family I36 protein n=1 Tax=Nocardia sp. NRRL S-836 TaxID=1519492 RepID=UPI0018D11429|nr:peptidase inhibitor family I36 protein [Nocardia sp. NRRL S-836]